MRSILSLSNVERIISIDLFGVIIITAVVIGRREIVVVVILIRGDSNGVVAVGGSHGWKFE
ncbi:hypothetical protein TSUD_259070 [Trifolium subterraneum]|uniref:Transmembrane protein n=1 Tax=Trifolium subterraneum TaxID=3900 RepID=A0A2Z6NGB6_TRISU|nr:hypothetical protein TSUD_259070 [Trifolium subterraneum]